MKLGLNIGYSGSSINLPMDRILEAENLGYDSVWSAEAYGSDAVTPLAYIAARTSRIKLGTGIAQIAGRTPAMLAMTMTTLDGLSGGRVIVGIGLSGPQVVEGWHGVPYGRPATRLREYIQVLRKIWAREEPATFDGKEYQLPYRGPDATGLGKPLKSIIHGRQLPIYVATLGPRNIASSAELADGWMPIWYSPWHADIFKPAVEEGFQKAGGGKSWKDFAVAVSAGVVINDDVQAALDSVKPQLALYVGGMGARGKNFYNDLAVKYGYVDAAAKIQDLYLAGRRDEAIAAVPDELADEVALCGPPDRIRERFRTWVDAGVTTFIVQSQQPEALQLMADITGVAKQPVS
ncbi:MAG: LLM class F420-dependent oxidoreductase [Dehalococcoidia bacterium]|nr:LLM class F420-dependent oxidoreductase [Dehalococcoidia bacterium]